MNSSSILIPKRFREAIVLHLMRCYAMDPDLGSGQILFLVGKPGTGKTFQLGHVLRECRLHVVNFGAREVEHPSAGEPVRLLRTRIEEVSRNIAQGVPSALVIDDADLILGRFELTQYTHNLQRVLAELMGTANSIRLGDGLRASSLPLFLVGNRKDLLHSPMLRFGRARIFEWKPEQSELMSVVSSIFFELADDDVEQLCLKFSDQSISFFSALRDALLDDYLLRILRDHGPANALKIVISRGASIRPRLAYSLPNAVEIGEYLLVEAHAGESREK